MLRLVVLLLGLACFAAPAAAQFATAPAAWALPTDEELDPVKGFVFEAFNNAGFNATRSGAMLHGFRVEPETGAFMGYRRGNWLMGSALSQYEDAASEESGAALDIGAAYGIDLSARQRLSVGGGVRFDLSSGLGLREPHALAPGAADNGLGLRLSWRYSFDRNRFVSTTLGYDQSFGDSLDNGLGDKNDTTFGTYFGYRFH
jgi:hypothetical protein